MKRSILLLLASMIASPALAQHSGHAEAPPSRASAPAAACKPEHAAMGHCTMAPGHPLPSEPAPSCTAEHAAMGHCTMAPPKPAPTPAACTPEHAAMGHCQMPAAQAPAAPPPLPAAPCTPEHAAMGHCAMPTQPSAPPATDDPHAGHAMPVRPTAPRDTASCAPEHAAMGHCTLSDEAEIAEAPPPPQAFTGPAHAQDIYFDRAAAARSRAQLAKEHGGLKAYRFLIDQLEASIGKGHDGYAWDAEFWYGGDIDKFWVKTEGEGEFGGELEEVEVQALWSRAINPWFDLQGGVRQDLRAGPDRTHLVLGIQGLAPYWFEVEGALFFSDKGDLTARAEAEYDLRLTQSLIFQPLAEIDISLQDVPELRLGSGVSTAEIGARLRYEFRPRSGLAVVAPYIGAQYERAFGDTARFRRASGEDAGGWRLLVGVRTWF